MKLSKKSLAQLPASVATPKYELGKISRKIAHIGVGAFHRAHAALYLDDLLNEKTTERWGIVGIGILPNDRKTFDALSSQDCLYTLIERDAHTESARIVGSIIEYVYAHNNISQAVEVLTDEAVGILSLTITEAGYCYDQGTDSLDKNIASIKSDIANPQNPCTAFGLITLGLKLRKERGMRPFTVMSCDNIQKNGDLTRKLILEFAAEIDKELAEWISKEVTFPNSMVDRITPATTAEDIKHVTETYNIDDAWPVCCETFKQWVIEDEFCNGRPELEKVGVQFTKDVGPFEKMKIRLLNASHSAMGYLGYLAGFRYIDQIAVDGEFRRYVRMMMDNEVTDTLDFVEGIDLNQYKTALLERFSNPNIKDTAARICMDGSGKIPKFILPTVRDRLKAGKSIALLTLVVSSWIKYLTGKDESGEQIILQDPIASDLQKAALESGRDPRIFIEQRHLFGDLADSEKFYNELKKQLEMLYSIGARKTLQSIIADS